jgi:hypothetical protein
MFKKHPPEVSISQSRTDLFDAFEKGALVFNYLDMEARTDYQQNEFGKNQMAKI